MDRSIADPTEAVLLVNIQLLIIILLVGATTRCSGVVNSEIPPP